jgi:hypothetical protein
LDAGDAVLAFGSFPGQSIGSTIAGIPITGRWPTTPPLPKNWTLIVSVSAADDTVPGDNIVVTIPLSINSAQPNYTTSLLTITSGNTAPVVPGGTVAFTLNINNISAAQDGTQPVTWTVYASTKNTLDGSTEFPVKSGTIVPLTHSTSTMVTDSGPWPLHYGLYYLLATVSVAEDINPPDNISFIGTTSVGIYSETEPNGDDQTLIETGQYNNFGVVNGIVFRPGMSIQVTGTMPVNDFDDIFAFNTGTASSFTFYASWANPNKVATLAVILADATFAPGGIVSPSATSLSLGWVKDVAGTQRWIELENGQYPATWGNYNLGNWTLVISAN